MSYSFNASGVRADVGDELREKGRAAAIAAVHDPEAEQAALEHVGAALDAVANLLEVVGRADDTVSVNVAGHANPDHAPRDGWSNEALSISISVSSARVEPTSEAEADTVGAFRSAAGEPEQVQRSQD